MYSKYKGEKSILNDTRRKQINKSSLWDVLQINRHSSFNKPKTERGERREKQEGNAFDYDRLWEHFKKMSCVDLVSILFQRKQL